jgi:hypothetical protein
MKKYYLIIVFIILLISLSLFLTLYFVEVANWSGWNAIAAISSFITSIGVLIVIYQLILQNKSYNIDELNYVMSLTNQFIEANNKYSKAWNILREYGSAIPKKMELEEWETIVEALTNCYESAYLNYQMAQLVDNKIIDLNTLYLLHFNFLSEHPDGKLSILHSWIGTGLELAANYDHEQLLTMVKSAKKFYSALYKLANQHGNAANEYQIDHIKEIEMDLLNTLKANENGSVNYDLDRMVDIIENNDDSK